MNQQHRTVNDTRTDRVADDAMIRYLRQCATSAEAGRKDLFHESVPDDFIAEVFAVMAHAHWHTFQLLTKRHGRMRALLASDEFCPRVDAAADGLGLECVNSLDPLPWPAPNVWLGVSAEDQRWWDIRVPALMATPAAVRFVSAEPLLGPIDMGLDRGKPAPDWLIIGGESGKGARPMPIEWARGMLAQCQQPGVPTVPFVKQLGSVLGRQLGAGPKGGDWDAWPGDLKVRQFPGRDDDTGQRRRALRHPPRPGHRAAHADGPAAPPGARRAATDEGKPGTVTLPVTGTGLSQPGSQPGN